jgi:leucyl aminopeptidase
MSRLSAAAAAILALALVAAAPAGDETWITLERGTAQQALAGLAAAGHPGALVVVDAGRPEALSTAARESDVVVGRISLNEVELLPEILHAARRRCGGFMRHTTREDAEQRAAQANDPEQRVPAPPIGYTIDNGPVVQALMAPISEASIRRGILALSTRFFTRRHTCPSGLQSATWIHDRWQQLAAARPDITVEYYDHIVTNQPSIILTIPGSALPSEVVVLGAHQDSIAGNGCGTKAPGADDDGSGVASLSEVIRVALKLNYRPLRTVKFMAYAAEESGLLGSDEIAQAYKNQNVNVVGVLQLDMTNYKGSSGDIYIFTDFTNPAQNTFVGNLVTTYLPGLVKGNSACGYACSDHASWTFRGYPSSFPFESTFSQDNPYIHSPLDDLAHSGGTAIHSVKFSKLAAAYMAEVAKGGFTRN